MQLRRFLLLILFLFTLPVWAISPELLCDQAKIEELTPSEKANMEEVCMYAGQYQESSLPDANATFSKKFRDGKANVYDYSDFFNSFTKSLNSVNRAEKCDPKKDNPRVAYPSVNIEKTAAGTIPVSVVKEEELNKIFSEISKDPKYAFDVVENGCWARAHIMARELEKRGIRVAKIFAEGALAVETKKALNGEGVMWTYHVAPVIAVETKNGVELRVIDPAMFDRAVPVKTWTDRMLPNKQFKDNVELYMTDRFVLDPLRGGSLKSIHEDPSRGRWHMAETVMAEQELEMRRRDLEDREIQKAYFKKLQQEGKL
ncbi:protein-glutamine glutaminase family protein [Bdellovibrio sp. BCCA]|uniref:protein-glutamine glutaminase family protein n=1 Tax=Bdellovibrio sp. BCCA TaxID=3136281 RepID=UPI0030EFF965